MASALSRASGSKKLENALSKKFGEAFFNFDKFNFGYISDFIFKTLCVYQANLWKNNSARLPTGNGLYRIIVFILFCIFSKRQTPKYFVIKLFYYDYRSQKFFTATILLKADIDTKQTHPNFTFMEKWTIFFVMNNFFIYMPFLKIFFYSFKYFKLKSSRNQRKNEWLTWSVRWAVRKMI